MTNKQRLQEIFGVSFVEKDNIIELRRFYSNNTFCVNEEGNIIGLCSCENDFEEITIPEEFKHLEYLNLSDNTSLKKLEFEVNLPKLFHLDVSDCVIESLDFPAGFEELKDVYLQGNKLRQVVFNGSYPTMRLLDISKNEPLSAIPTNLALFPSLQYVFVYQSPIYLGEENIAEATGNAWDRIRRYLIELGKGSKKNYRAKLVVVGNGRVGKTSMIKKLRGEAFDPNEKYTHGITLGELNNEHLKRIESQDLAIQVWDFGGQDIFYATHQFFMTNSALYLLAWTNYQNIIPYKKLMETEAVEFGEKWREEQNWLENIRMRAIKAPIIMVQTHCDNFGNRLPLQTHFSEEPYQVQACNFSASEDDIGKGELKLLINNGLEELPHFGREYPQTYDNVIEGILREKVDQPFITIERYKVICIEAGIDDNQATRDELLSYLNNTGICVHYPESERLNGKIFIDPVWLTQSVYALLNKQLKEVNGKMDDYYVEERLKELQAKKNIQIEKEDLIELLKNFHLIFETEEESETNGVMEKRYIYPDYLPEKLKGDTLKLFKKLKKEMNSSFHFQFSRYLPENILINIISHYGPDTTEDVVFKNGILFQNEGEEAIIEFNPETKIFSIYTKDLASSKQLQGDICRKLNEFGRSTEKELTVDISKGFVKWADLKRDQLSKSFYENPDSEGNLVWSDTGEKHHLCDYVHLVSNDMHYWLLEYRKRKEEEHHGNELQKLPPIYFSYAWKDNENPDREKLVEQIYQELDKAGFNIHRDKEKSKYGEDINKFMQEIGRGRLVLVFLSKKYLKSVYCMSELFLIADKSDWSKNEFRERILPIQVEDIDFKDMDFRKELMRYWIKIEKEEQDYIDEFKEYLGDDEKDQRERRMRIANKFSRLITNIENFNRGGIELYQKNDFEIIKEKIKERLVQNDDFQMHQELYERLLNAFNDSLDNRLGDLKSALLSNLSVEFRSLDLQLNKALVGIEDLKSFQEDHRNILTQLDHKASTSNKEVLEDLDAKLEKLINESLPNLPKTIIDLWKEANMKDPINPDVKGKLKIKFDLIPFVVYEKEVNWDIKNIFKDIVKDIKSGNIFTKPG